MDKVCYLDSININNLVESDLIDLFLSSGKLTYYTQPPAIPKVSNTKIITELSTGFDIDALFQEETKAIDEMDDTKVIVDGMQMESNEPTQVNFDGLDSDEESDEDSEDSEMYEMNEDEMEDDEEDAENGKSDVVFKSDVVLNPKKAKKNRDDEAKRIEAEDYTGMSRRKQTTDRMSIRKKILDDKNNVEKEVYSTENIPRTKKLQKMEMKKQLRKMRKNGKSF